MAFISTRGLRPQVVFKVCKRGLRTVPAHIVRPSYAVTGAVAPSPPQIILQSEADIAGLRTAGQIARRALEHGERLFVFVFLFMFKLEHDSSLAISE